MMLSELNCEEAKSALLWCKISTIIKGFCWAAFSVCTCVIYASQGSMGNDDLAQ